MNKKALLTAGIALALGLPVAGQAQVLFDADGGFNDLGDAPTLTDSFDFLPGNVLAVDIVPLAVGNTFTLLYHAEVVEIVRSTAANLGPPVGPDGPAELTAVAQLREEVLAITDLPGGTPGVPEIATFTHLGGTFNIYYDNFTGGTTNADDETTNGGAGYNDGTLILSGMILPATIGAQFTVTDSSGTAPLDAFSGVNGTPAATTVLGQGSTDLVITVGVTSFDPAFFPEGIGSLEFSSSLRLNFNTINNSIVFEQITGADIVPDFGAGPLAGVNGQPAAGETTPQDFQFLADGSASLNQIPEPTSITLLGLGLGGLGLLGIAGNRRRQTA